MSFSPSYRPDPVYPLIGEGFYDAVEAADFPRTLLRYRNERWATRVGLGDLNEAEWVEHFGRFTPLPDNVPHPLAMRYHGHQFQHYNPDIGDGRGFLFAQLRDVKDNRLLDLGTKGSGQTPYSRSADGRLTLKGGVREVLITALLEALGVYTSKSFSLIETGEKLYRNDEPSPTRSAVLVRLNHSHIRFGTFQRHAFEQSPERLTKLVDYAVKYYYPQLASVQGADKVTAFLREVSARTADLVGAWMAAGFVHGVLNTDNMNISGESFDYGPYRLLPHYEPGFTAAYFDETGLYAYGRQPEAVFWNLKQLAGALSLIAPKDDLVEALEGFGHLYQHALETHLLRRLGVVSCGSDADRAMLSALFNFLAESKIPFEHIFFDWYGGRVSHERAAQSPMAEQYQSAVFKTFENLLASYEAAEPNRLEHSYFKGKQPCTLVIDEIEALWAQIAEHDDWTAFEDKLAQIEEMRQALQNPV